MNSKIRCDVCVQRHQVCQGCRKELHWRTRCGKKDVADGHASDTQLALYGTSLASAVKKHLCSAQHCERGDTDARENVQIRECFRADTLHCSTSHHHTHHARQMCP